MKNRFILPVLLSALIVSGVGFSMGETASAQSANFPSGCASGLGYSATTGEPCNGTNNVTARYMSGCSNSALGYSASTGLPCSGSSVAIQWLAGCNSTIGYSSITGEPCNGTDFATPIIFPNPNVPGFPMTGAGGNWFSTLVFLLSSATIAVAGSTYLIRQSREVS